MSAVRKLIVSGALVLGTLAGVLTLGVGAASAAGHPKLGELEKCTSAFNQPWGLATDSSGHVFVTDAQAVKVYKFNSSNTCETEFKSNAWEPAGYVRSVAVNNSTGIVYVADSGSEAEYAFKPESGSYKQIQQFVPVTRNYMYTAVDNSSGPHAGNVYISEAQTTVTVYKTNANGELESAGKKELTAPLGGFGLLSEFVGGVEEGSGGSAVDPATGKVYVGEAEHKKVSVYSSSDVLEKQFSGSETPAGSFEPTGVAVDDTTGHIYVDDQVHKVVDEFDSTGKYLKQLTGFTKPLDVAVQNAAGSTQGDIYVSDGKVVDIFGPEVTPKFALTVTKTGTGSGTVKSTPAGINCGSECSHEFNEGTEVELTAEAALGSSFAAWSGACSGSGTCKVTMSEAKAVKAEFTLNPPTNTSLPTVSGVAQEGHTLKGTNGSWEGSPTSFSYQWEDCNAAGEACTSIIGANAIEYTLTKADVGHTVRLAVTAKNAGGASAPAASNQTAVVVAGASNEAPINVEGEVPFTQSLTAGCTSVYLGEFLPGVEHTYTNTCALVATSTAAESKLTAADSEPANHQGHLVNGTFFLPKALEVKAQDAESVGSLAPLTSPVTLLTYGTPVSADEITTTFSQPIAKHDGLHTGKYAKTITLTLSTVTP